MKPPNQTTTSSPRPAISPAQARTLSDRELVDAIQAAEPVGISIIDEYYRRCIPLYLDFIGVHWHTGFYLPGDNEVSPLDQVRMIDHILDAAKLNRHSRVLDVGCGIGATVCYLNVQHQCQAVGLTPVLEQQKMGYYLAQQQRATVQIDIGHAEQLPYSDNSFDCVCFFESACHFQDRQRFFNEALRVLKPGGYLLGEDWIAGAKAGRADQNQHVLEVCKTWAIPMLGTAQEYSAHLNGAGFVQVRVSDMRECMPLQRGFAVSAQQQAELLDDIAQCDQPLLALTLSGLQKLGLAFREQAFTIGQFSAQKPTS